MNTRCPPKRVPSAASFFTRCELTVQPPQSYSIGGQRSSGQLTGKPAGARPDYRGRWCGAVVISTGPSSHQFLHFVQEMHWGKYQLATVLQQKHFDQKTAKLQAQQLNLDSVLRVTHTQKKSYVTFVLD
ncbi:UNVERIFIED_CONTAM: hypothetical protein FKN15_070360 [Acipenser sinensis]